KAQRLPVEEPKVRNLFLNQRVSPATTLITRADWLDCASSTPISFEQGEEIFCALDLSSTNDLTALIVASVDEPTRVIPYFWKPEQLLSAHSKRDFGSGDFRYVRWQQDGHLLATPGRSINLETIALFIAELYARFTVRGLAYDRWGCSYLLREF